MLNTLLKTGSWSDLRELASGRLLRVFPPRSIAALASELLRGRRDDDLVKQTRASVAEACDLVGVPVTFEPSDGPDIDGEQLLALYFSQILGSDTAFIDIRKRTFDGPTWTPGKLVIQWEPEFLSALRELYRSFYEDRPDDFEDAVADLGLPGTADLFRQNFGEDQSAVGFDLDSFRDTFQGILEESQRRGSTLDEQVGALGIYLICLYEHMEELDGGPYDVRTVFLQTQTRLETSQEPT